MIAPSTDGFTLCPTCASVAGFPRGHRARPQACRCHREDEPRWPGYDFNEHLDLCWCCLLEPISSGSKWSSFYCGDCREWVCRYNAAAGRVVLYLGRHSLMNGVVAHGPALASPEEGKAFAAALHGFALGLLGFYDAMAAWRPARLQTVLQAAAAGDVEAAGPPILPLPGYLDLAARLSADPRLGKGAAFTALADHLGLPPPPWRE